MMLSESMLRTGRYLRTHKDIFPYLFILSLSVAILLTREVNVRPSSFISTVISVSIALLSIIIRWLSMRTDAERMPELIKAKGIYSVVRHPMYISNFLMVFALSLYLGILWYLVFVTFFSVLITERIVFQKENCQHNKYGEDFKTWCKTTGALFPRMLNWQSAENSRTWLYTAKNIASFVLASATIFFVISFIKHRIIELTFGVAIGWIVALVIVLIAYVFIKSKKIN
ncbi:MAG: methyltransferase [Rikenellaceae bacterium]